MRGSALVTTLIVVMAAAGVFHLSPAHRRSNRETALENAESAIAMEQVIQTQGSHLGGTGRLAFDWSHGVAPSLNKFAGSRSLPGSGGLVVPADALQAGGSQRTVEIPPFPYAIASEGPISGRALLVGQARRSCDVLSRGTSPSTKASILGAPTRVIGDVKATGGIQLDPQAVPSDYFGSPSQGGALSFDLDEFLSLGDGARVILWREP